MSYFFRILLWPLLIISQLVALLLLSWHALAQVDFAYPLGYRLLSLQDHIAEYAPLNRYKKGFEYTDAQDHWHLFSAINEAIHNNGAGLAHIHYHNGAQQRLSLLREAEIIHLQDVAKLVNNLYNAGLICGIFWLGLLMLAYRHQVAFPPIKNILTGVFIGIGVVTIIVLGIGPTSVFYWLHVQIFPDNHQWFFYYQDSLMTTLMKAPDIFAFIALLIISVWIFLWCTSIWLTARLLYQRSR